MLKTHLLFLFFTLSITNIEGAWLDRKAEGWAWYEDKEKLKKKEPKNDIEPKSAKEELDLQKQILEEKLAKAMLNPSEENIRDYMVEQKRWLDQSSILANIWGKILLSNPELDPTATTPITHYGLQVHKEIELEEKKNFIAKLSKDYGLFFFYEGNSKLSHAITNVVKIFSERYQWDVVAISVDGTVLQGFQNSKQDNGISKKLGIKIFPSIFIVSPQKNEVTPVGYGLVSVDQLEENIIAQFKPHQHAVNND